MAAINLLPGELTTSKTVVKVTGLIKKILVPAIALYLISVIVMVAVIFVLNGDSKELAARQDVLISSIKNLEQTERSIFLLQERLSKIKNILTIESSKDGLTTNIQDLLTQSQNIQNIDISTINWVSGKIDLTATLSTSDQMEQFLKQLIESPFVKGINMKSFSFSPAIGYNLNLILTTK